MLWKNTLHRSIRHHHCDEERCLDNHFSLGPAGPSINYDKYYIILPYKAGTYRARYRLLNGNKLQDNLMTHLVTALQANV